MRDKGMFMNNQNLKKKCLNKIRFSLNFEKPGNYFLKF